MTNEESLMKVEELLGIMLIRLESIEESTKTPMFWNKSTIARKYGFNCVTRIKPWQLPNFGIPEHFNGISPMYKVSDVLNIMENQHYYKEQWGRKTIKEKMEIQNQIESIKQKEKVIV